MLADIGANLVDPMFQGCYHGKQYHEADLPAVLERSWAAGLQRIIITATNLEESKAALALARTHGELQRSVSEVPTIQGPYVRKSH